MLNQKGWEIFSQSHETQNYILKQFIINRSTIRKSSNSQNDMTVRFHLLTSPLVITSCQNGFLYSALATSSGSNLKKQNKKERKKQKNSAPDCERLLHCAEFGQGHVHVCRFAIDDIYILTKRSERGIIAVFTNVEYNQIYSSSVIDVLRHVMPSCYGHHAAEPIQTVRLFTRNVWNK